LYFDQEIFEGGDSFPSQPGYHADATTFSEAVELLLGATRTGSFERTDGSNAWNGAEKTKGMAAKKRGRYIAHRIESKQRGGGYYESGGMRDTTWASYSDTDEIAALPSRGSPAGSGIRKHDGSLMIIINEPANRGIKKST
jgi:hypothetical protein